MTINTIKYEDEMKKSYIDYAMSVIVQRALPDIRDGLKPVHRRILYTMKELGNFHDKPHKKSARIVGDVLGKYHPHGDSSVYDAMVRLAQDFNMQAPLVDGHGNFGSIDGDSAAAMRYTEARLSPLANELLRDLDIGIVEMMPNFDNTLKEPKVLPTRFPHLLVNGSSGIAVGMATSIPPHNLKEVIDATMALLDRPQLTIAQLMKYLPGPDFPTGGIISNKEDLLDVYETGRGKLKVRAKIEKEGKKNLVVTEIPYTLAGNKTKILEDIIKLMTERRFDEISDIFDESSKDGLRIVIELKRGADQDMVMNKLFKLTKLEDTFGVNLLAIKDKSPISFSLKGMIEEYIAFLKEIHHKRLTHDLNKLQSRKEVLDGLIKATDMIDLIIEILRGSKDLKTAKDCLITGKTERITFKTKKSEKEAGKMCFTEIQASAILTMQLQRLIGLELEKLEKEKGEIGVQIDVIETILSTEENFHNHLKDDLKRIKKTYGKKRLTQIDTLELSEIPEKEIPVEDLYALIDKFGYLKLVDSMSFNRMAHDGYERIIPVKSNETLKFFTYDGMMSQIKLSDVEISKSKDRGTPIDVLVDTSIDNVALIESDFDKVMFTTLKGFIKIVDASEFATRNKTIKATKLSDGDRVISVIPVMEEHKEVVITTKEKRELRFMVGEIPEQKKTAVGVVGINLNANDEVDKAELTQETEEKKRKRGAKGLAV